MRFERNTSVGGFGGHAGTCSWRMNSRYVFVRGFPKKTKHDDFVPASVVMRSLWKTREKLKSKQSRRSPRKKYTILYIFKPNRLDRIDRVLFPRYAIFNNASSLRFTTTLFGFECNRCARHTTDFVSSTLKHPSLNDCEHWTVFEITLPLSTHTHP